VVSALVRAAVGTLAPLPQAWHEAQLPHAPSLLMLASSHRARSRASPRLRIDAPMRVANHSLKAAGMNFHTTYSQAAATMQQTRSI